MSEASARNGGQRCLQNVDGVSAGFYSHGLHGRLDLHVRHGTARDYLCVSASAGDAAWNSPRSFRKDTPTASPTLVVPIWLLHEGMTSRTSLLGHGLATLHGDSTRAVVPTRD